MEKRRIALMALAAVVLTLGALWYVHRPVILHEATMAEVETEAARGGYRLMDTEKLAQICQQPLVNFILVDTRQPWEYQCGYITGAVNFPMEATWWFRWRSQGRLESLLGPDKNRLIVFY